MTLVPQPLAADAFRPFGEVICTAGHDAELINAGHTQKFSDLAKIDTGDGGGRTAVHIYRSQPLSLPLKIEVMERHPLGSQAFMPLSGHPFLVIVAPAGDVPEPAAVRAFLSDGRQGINLRPGVWHHYQVSLMQVSDYLVIDRVGPGNNFEEQPLIPPLLIESPGQGVAE